MSIDTPTTQIEPSDQVEPSDVLRIVLPWPSRKLSPNARHHWAVKAKLVKQARREAAAVAAEAIGLAEPSGWPERIAMRITLFPPDRRRRDFDNAIASLKPMLDGIADALGVDDSRFRPVFAFAEPGEGRGVAVELPLKCSRKPVEREEGILASRVALPEWLRS